MQNKLSVNIGKLQLKNPLTVASGTFGYAEEFSGFMDLKKLGAVTTKTITLKPRKGNPPPRTCETPAGMLNSIGLENPGVEVFLKEKFPALRKIGVPVIVSIASQKNPDEFVRLARRLDKVREVAALELNISCPNLSKTKLISQDPRATYSLVSSVRRVTKKTLITKLSPNVTDIVEVAIAAERGGSDALAMINTLTGMSINVNSRKPKISSFVAGLSGPAIRPIAVRMVWEAYNKVIIPIIGMGGIVDAESALEFMFAGASVVAVGTANFINPRSSVEIIEGIKKYMRKNKLRDIKALTGRLRV
ncbi:dihydroorotate dehydrogenase [Candidatus Omnitrophota bacterium]